MRSVEHSPDELAKDWLVRIIERTPVDQLDELPVAWISREAPALIAEILSGLADPRAAPGLAPPAEGHSPADQLARLRSTAAAAAQVPRYIAALQAAIVSALRRRSESDEASELGRRVERLAEIFGEIQAGVTEALVRERSGGARRDPLTGLPGSAELHEWLSILLAGYHRYGQPFSLLAVDLEGLKRINYAYGQDAGDRMLLAVADVIRREVGTVDRAFRVSGDEFIVLAPSQDTAQARPLGQRLRRIIERSQTAEGPRIEISVGVASCPAHGDEASALLEAAEEATYRAKAGGEGVAEGVASPGDPVQDR